MRCQAVKLGGASCPAGLSALLMRVGEVKRRSGSDGLQVRPDGTSFGRRFGVGTSTEVPPRLVIVLLRQRPFSRHDQFNNAVNLITSEIPPTTTAENRNNSIAFPRPQTKRETAKTVTPTTKTVTRPAVDNVAMNVGARSNVDKTISRSQLSFGLSSPFITQITD